MRKFTFSFKSLLLAAGLLLGSANAWGGDVTTIYERGTTNAWASADLEDWPAQYCTPTIDGGLKVSTKNAGWTCTKAISTTANSIVTLTATIHTGGASGRSGSYDYIKIGGIEVRFNEQDNVASIAIDEAVSELTLTYNRTSDYNVEIEIDQSNGAVSYTVGSASGTSTTSTAISNVVFGHHKAGRENYDINPVLKKIDVSEEEQEVETADYTINYIYNSATIGSTEGNVAVGTTVNAVNPITISDVKYYAKAGETTSMVIAKGTNVLNVDLRLAETWNYTVRALDGSSNVLNDNLASGSVTEGETATVPNPQYVLSGTTLYNIASASSDWYRRGITPTANNYVYDLTYNNGTVENVVFYTEAEAVSGATTQDMTSRASNGQVGYTAGSDSYVDATTLSPGKYKIYARTVTANSGERTFNFKVGDVNVYTFVVDGSNTNNLKTSDEFIVSESSTLSFACNGGAGSGNGLDWFYVQKTGNYEVELTSSANLRGYKTFYNAESNYQVDENTTIYKASATKETVTLTSVDGDIIPKNTPVVLKTTNTTDYTIALTATETASTGDFTGNALLVAAGSVSDVYILAYTDAYGFGFYNFTGTLDAGDVYLAIPSSGVKMFNVVVNGETVTGVEAPVAAEAEEEEILYNTAGQQVTKDYKGVVINQKGEKRFQK